jgi:hypothetical protein
MPFLPGGTIIGIRIVAAPVNWKLSGMGREISPATPAPPELIMLMEAIAESLESLSSSWLGTVEFDVSSGPGGSAVWDVPSLVISLAAEALAFSSAWTFKFPISKKEEKRKMLERILETSFDVTLMAQPPFAERTTVPQEKKVRLRKPLWDR